MSSNFYEAELRERLQIAFASCRVKEVGDSAPFFAQLMKTYPVRGSKIDWSRVPDSIERFEEEVERQAKLFMQFFSELIQRFHLAGDVTYVGDSATDFALAGSLEHITEVLPELLTIPQHHYLIGAEFSWCMCLTMEGDMGFGFRPSLTRIA